MWIEFSRWRARTGCCLRSGRPGNDRSRHTGRKNALLLATRRRPVVIVCPREVGFDGLAVTIPFAAPGGIALARRYGFGPVHGARPGEVVAHAVGFGERSLRRQHFFREG